MIIIKKWNEQKDIIKQSLFLVIIACVLGIIFNLGFLGKSLDGTLIKEIKAKQLAELKDKAEQLSSDIHFVDLVDAKKLFDEEEGLFLDARSPDDYIEGHIEGAINISLLSALKQEINITAYLPDKEQIIVTYCSGEECDVGVEMAKILIDMQYINVYVLAEGFPGWSEVGFPVSTMEGGLKS